VKSTVAAILATLLLLTGCGSDDGGTAAGPAAGPADAEELPEVTACSFAARDDGVVTGTATVEGRNTTGEAIDSTSIRFELLDADGERIGEERFTTLSFWAPDEEVALQVPMFSEEPIESADCRITDVSTGYYAEQEEFDADAATCEVTGERNPTAVVDLSGVDDIPADADLVIEAAVHQDGVRVGTANPRHEAGATTAEGGAPYDGDDLACRVLQVRLP
jgi:hypothetical protein